MARPGRSRKDVGGGARAIGRRRLERARAPALAQTLEAARGLGVGLSQCAVLNSRGFICAGSLPLFFGLRTLWLEGTG